MICLPSDYTERRFSTLEECQAENRPIKISIFDKWTSGPCGGEPCDQACLRVLLGIGIQLDLVLLVSVYHSLMILAIVLVKLL